jgi:hypothetical protein
MDSDSERLETVSDEYVGWNLFRTAREKIISTMSSSKNPSNSKKKRKSTRR